MVRRALVAFVVCILATAVPAEDVVLGLSQDTVAITTNFDGDDILIFGAVKREAPLLETPLDVVITVAGPSTPVVVRKKDRRFGIWVNTEAVTVDAAPSFYAVASSAPLEQILSNTENLRHAITVDQAIRLVGESENAADVGRFSDAVIRIRNSQEVYQSLEGAVDLREQTLFKTSISLPANLTEGGYQTRVFLLRDKAVVSQLSAVIEVEKVGLERWLFSLSRQQPLAYGIMSLAIAIFAGWAASAAFRLFRLG